MKNTIQNLIQVTNSLESNKHALNNLFFFNPSDLQSTKYYRNYYGEVLTVGKANTNKAGILNKKQNVFITDNSVHFDSNVIIKKNSQFLPKIKNSVNEYQNEQNKLNYWPSSEESEDSSNIFNIMNENIDTSSNTNQKKTVSIEYFKIEEDKDNSNRIENKETFEIIASSFLDKKNYAVVRNSGFVHPNSDFYCYNNKNGEEDYNSSSKEETKIINLTKPNIIYQKKVEISKLNKIKKGSLINNKVIEHLNNNIEYNLKKRLEFKNTYNTKVVPALTFARRRNTTISQYLNTMSITNSKINTSPNLAKKYGTLLKYNNIISYNFLQNKQITNYSKNKNEGLLTQDKNITKEIIEETYKLLFLYFKSNYCLISKPVISITPDKVNIQLFYYLTIPKKKIIKLFAIHYLNSFKNKWINNYLNKKKVNSLFYNPSYAVVAKASNKYLNGGTNKIRLPFINGKARKSISRLKSKPSFIKNIIFNLIKYNIAKVFSYKFKLICEILSSKFNKAVELELIRLHNPYQDSNILANLLHLIIKNKRKKPKIAIDKIYNKNQVKKLNDPNLISVNNKPAFLSGLNFYINGRTMGEAIVPRMTTKSFEKGATATGKVNYLDKSTITKKNKKGAYTIKVISAQNFY